MRRRELADAARILGIASVELGRLSRRRARTRRCRHARRRRRRIHSAQAPDRGSHVRPRGRADRTRRSRRDVARRHRGIFPRRGWPRHTPTRISRPHRAARLYFHAWDFPLAEKRLKLESVPGTARIDVRAFKERKSAAFAAHATQQGSAGVFFSSAFPDVEVLAFAAGVPQPAAIVDDVFAGL